jgi:hypothetical protein
LGQVRIEVINKINRSVFLNVDAGLYVPRK